MNKGTVRTLLKKDAVRDLESELSTDSKWYGKDVTLASGDESYVIKAGPSIESLLERQAVLQEFKKRTGANG